MSSFVYVLYFPELLSGSRPAQKVPNPRIQIHKVATKNIHEKTNWIYLPTEKQNNCAHIMFYFIEVDLVTVWQMLYHVRLKAKNLQSFYVW